MKIVRVQYTTTQKFAATNAENIRKVVEELKKLDHKGIAYSTFLLPDEKTFMHLDQFENEEAHEVLQSLGSFKNFSDELWASGLEVEPKLELLTMVGSAGNI